MKHDYIWLNYLAASVDILGQKEAFKDIEDIPTDEESEKKLIEVSKESIAFIEKFRESFDNLLTTEEIEPIIEVPEDKKEIFFKLRQSSEKKYQFFSDSMVVFVSLGDENYHANAANSVFEILAGVGGMMLSTLAVGKPFRAGIDVGLGIELKKGDVYGPALIKAYMLESKAADYPRIVIGNKLLHYLDGLSKKFPQIANQDEDDLEFCKIIANICLSMITIDLDGYPILDYLGEEFNKRILQKLEQSEKIKEEAFNFIKNEYEKKRNSKEGEESRKLALRYYLLLNYFKSRLRK